MREVKIAAIAAAGWKGSGCKTDPPPHTPEFLTPLAGCPESLLPLGNGETILSRLSKQLKVLGYERVYIGVGKPGCRYKYRVVDRQRWRGPRFLTKQAVEYGYTKSPWSEAKVDYCQQFGTTVEIEEPGLAGKHVTFLKILDRIEEPLRHVTLICGDYLFTNALIEEVVSCGLCIFLLQRSEVITLDAVGLRTYREVVSDCKSLLKPHYPSWNHIEAEERFRAIGIPYLNMRDEYPRERWDEWMDVDFPAEIQFSTYPQALEWMRRHGNEDFGNRWWRLHWVNSDPTPAPAWTLCESS